MSSNKNALLPNIKLTYGKRKINLESLTVILLKPLFFLFIYFAAFGRSEGIGGLSGGLAAVLFGFSIFIITAFHYLFINKEKTVSPLFWMVLIFFIYLSIKPMASFMVYGEKGTSIIRYSIEILVNFGMLFSVYYSIKNKIISPKYYLYVFAILGVVVTLPLLMNLTGRSTLRRISGLGGALNYTGNVLAICTVIWAMIIYRLSQYKRKKYFRQSFYVFGLFIVFLGLFLTGARSGIVALLVGLTLLQIFGMQSRLFVKYILAIGILTLSFLFILTFYVDISFLLERFSIDALMRGASVRFGLYSKAITDLTAVEFFFGRPDFYTFTNEVAGTRIVNTHNLFLSLIRYNGLLSFIIFMFILAGIYYAYAKIYISRHKNDIFRLTESTVIILLTMSLIYSMFSGGRSTKIFIVFINLGYSIGYIELMRNVTSVKEYKKLIL